MIANTDQAFGFFCFSVCRRAGGITVGEGKAYDTADHFAALRYMNVTPHVVHNDTPRRSAIDGRTTRHTGYRMSQSRRPLIEWILGWGKQHGTMRPQ